MMFVIFFFKQKTAYEMRISDWSSDVCSSDLLLHDGFRRLISRRVKNGELSEAEGAELAQFYESRYDAYTYLAVNGVKQRSRRKIGRASCRERVCQYV